MPLNKQVFSAKWFKWVWLIFYGAMWTAWAAIPLVVLLKLMPSAGPGGLLWLTRYWIWLIGAWAGSVVFLFLWLLATINRGANATVTQCLLEILCSLSLGLPSILLGAVPFFAFNVKSLQQLFPYGNIVDLRSAEDAGGRHPNIYIIGVDISTSFVPPTVVPIKEGSEEPRVTDRLDVVAHTIDDLFKETGVIGRTLKADDILIVWTFDGQPAGNPWAHNKGNANTRQAILRRIAAGEFKKHIRSDSREVNDPTTTNLLEFLNTSVLDSLDQEKSYHRAKVILFTDLHQVAILDKHKGRNADVASIDRKIRKLARRIKRNEKLAVVAFTAAPGAEVTPDHIDRDLLRPFNGLLRPSHWQAHDLEHFRGCTDVEKVVLMASLYQNVRDEGTIYLKYDTSRDNEPLESYLMLGDDVSAITLGLRRRYASNLADQAARENIRVTVGPEQTSCSLELQRGEMSAQLLDLGRDNSVPVVLDSGFGVGESQAELLVEISPMTIYRVPIAVLPMEDVAVHAIKQLGWILFFLNLVPVVLAVRSVYGEARILFPPAQPAGAHDGMVDRGRLIRRLAGLGRQRRQHKPGD